MQQLILSTGRKLAFEEYGDPGGVPAFYFHGWPSSRVQAVLMDGIGKEMGIRIVSPDRPGIGDSEHHPGRRLLDWPRLLTELADHLGWGKFHVFGVSGGGPYSLVTAHTLPERVLSANIICGAPPLKLLGTQELFWMYRATLAIRRGLPFLLDPVFYFGGKISRQSPRQAPMRWLLATLDAADRRALSDAAHLSVITEGFRQSIRNGVRPVRDDADIYLDDWGFNPAEIRIPVRFWHGKKDRNIPWTYAQRLSAMIPGAITRWTEEDGHYSLPITQNRAIAEAALQGTSGQARSMAENLVSPSNQPSSQP